jgi:hypothetical protein
MTWVRLIPYAVLLVNVQSEFGMSVDDPYITFRYAQNFIHGHGPVFNIGERVEGFTSALHMLLCAAALEVAPSADILIKAKLLSLLFGLLILHQTWQLSRMFGMSKWQSLGVQMLLALDRNFAITSSNGLETTLYTFLLLLTVRMFVSEILKGKGILSSFALFAATMTRPEGMLIAVALFVCRVYYCRRDHRSPIFVANWIAPFLLLLVAAEATRVVYFGQLFPNTYYAKSTSLSTSFSSGLKYMFRSFCDAYPYHGRGISKLLTIAVLVPICIGFSRAAKRKAGVLALAIVLAQVLFILKSGGDWMPGMRFLIPIEPYLLTAFCLGCHTSVAWILQARAQAVKHSSGISFSLYAVPLLLVFISATFRIIESSWTSNIAWSQVGFSVHGADLIGGNGVPFRHAWVDTSNYISHAYRPGARIAYSEMGYTSYENMDKQFIDMRGLNDMEIAHVSNALHTAVGVSNAEPYSSRDAYWQSVVSRKPDAIFVLSLASTGRISFPISNYRSRRLTYPDFCFQEYKNEHHD